MNKSFNKHLTSSAQRMSYVITNDKKLGMSLMQVINCKPKLKKPSVINISGCLDQYKIISSPIFIGSMPVNFIDTAI